MPFVIGRVGQWVIAGGVAWLAGKALTDVAEDAAKVGDTAAGAVETVSDAALNMAIAAAIGVGAFAALQVVQE